VALSFGIGNIGSGVQWHVHGPGYSESLHGRKYWILHPPSVVPPPYMNPHEQSSRQWMEQYYYPVVHDHNNNHPTENESWYECTGM
jgi:hypothetical protein